MEDRYFFVFNSRNQAVYLEEKLKEQGYRVQIRSTPERLAKSCNTSLVVSVELAEIKNIRQQIMKRGASIRGIYKAVQAGQFTDYVKVY